MVQLSGIRAFASRFLVVSFAGLFVGSSTVSFPPTAEAQVAAPAEILMIGNSLTRGVGRSLRRLLRADGIDVTVRSRAPSGYRLYDHVARGAAARKILRRPWDVVVLQEQSDGIGQDRYISARDLHEIIAANGSQTMFFMTWRRRGQGPDTYDNLRGVPGGSIGYLPIAFELGAPVAPVGWAFREAIVRDPQANLWADPVHANRAGTYLAACVFYATITGRSPVGMATYPRSVGAAGALSLQRLARDTVLTDPAEWNIPELP